MIEFKLSGKVLPREYAFGLTVPLEMIWHTPTGTVFHFLFHIEAGEIDATCRTEEEFNQDTLADAITGVRLIVDGVASLHSFATGSPLTVVVDAAQPPGAGQRVPLHLSNSALGALCTAFTPEAAGPIWEIVLQDFALVLIFSDAAKALSLPHYQPIACGRVLDGIRNYVAPDLDVRRGWEAVRENLNVTQSMLEYVTERAKKPRHRERDQLDSAQVGQCLRNTWTVANRFLEWLKHGRTRLGDLGFPPLQ